MMTRDRNVTAATVDRTGRPWAWEYSSSRKSIEALANALNAAMTDVNTAPPTESTKGIAMRMRAMTGHERPNSLRMLGMLLAKSAKQTTSA